MISTKPDVAREGKYTISQTARALGIARSTVQVKLATGDITGKPSGKGRLYISGREIIRYWQFN